jgi:hypothetical protein
MFSAEQVSCTSWPLICTTHGCVHIQARYSTHTHTHIHTHTYTHMHAYLHTTHTHTYTRKHTHAHTHPHIHTSTRTGRTPCSLMTTRRVSCSRVTRLVFTSVTKTPLTWTSTRSPSTTGGDDPYNITKYKYTCTYVACDCYSHVCLGLARTVYTYTMYVQYFWQGNHQIYGYVYGSGQPYAC